MSTQWFEIKLEEPLLLGQIKADTKLLSSQTYIPGRVLRGAWADWLTAQGQTKDIAAVVQGVQIGNFFPATDWRSINYTSPSLLTMLTCKRAGGFKTTPGKSQEQHGVIDTLLPQLAYHLLEQAGAKFAVPFSLVCQECQQRMEPGSGFFTVYQEGRNLRYAQTSLKYHLHTRVALSRQRRAAQEEMLYSTTAISPKTNSPDGRNEVNLTFIGRVTGPDSKIDDLVEALNQVSIGAMHTRGYGCICVKPHPIILPSVQERITVFNQLLAQLWQDIKRLATNTSTLPDKPSGLYFSVDLLAPGVFYTKGIPSLTPEIQIGGQILRPDFWLTRPAFAGGWSDAWGLPKPTNLAARMGSVYVFQWNGPQDTLISALEQIEFTGIGGCRDEGFGECWVCHPFHQEVKEQ